MRRILFDSLRASKCFLPLFLAPLALLGCQNKVQQTSIDIGGGMRKGDPPMCFQYRVEPRATQDAYDIFLHVNNSCRYSVDCTFTNDQNEREHRVVQPAHQAVSYVVVENVPVKRVDVDAECVWKP
ncbi:MAG TPA: hypothetical protein VFZ53_12620 [Polyangiaceae bacterium]